MFNVIISLLAPTFISDNIPQILKIGGQIQDPYKATRTNHAVSINADPSLSLFKLRSSD